MSITYREQPQERQDRLPITVKLDGRVIGKITRVTGGYRYRPAGSKQTSETFADLEALKSSLEGEVA